MEKIYLTAFSLYRGALDEYAEKVESIFDSKGADYTGPVKVETFSFSGPLNNGFSRRELETAPKWVQSLDFRDDDYSRLRSFNKAKDTGNIMLFGRRFLLTDNRATQEAMSVPLPDTVCLHVEVDTIDQYSGGKHTPYTYDPDRDHVTDSS
ncbi:hypothetical protein [Natrinema gelatinilyticum]|uniref:hypothetical protein n=1 Tax=Natrinema gelatinilyticum TaxID=2961571 RepID=UPI0020C54446|nr:hypothetical protein [Natrinema gelatinilyticum]